MSCVIFPCLELFREPWKSLTRSSRIFFELDVHLVVFSIHNTHTCECLRLCTTLAPLSLINRYEHLSIWATCCDLRGRWTHSLLQIQCQQRKHKDVLKAGNTMSWNQYPSNFVLNWMPGQNVSHLVYPKVDHLVLLQSSDSDVYILQDISTDFFNIPADIYVQYMAYKTDHSTLNFPWQHSWSIFDYKALTPPSHTT